jgi:pimeloyl-ACP methyl ester carboxylesterase
LQHHDADINGIRMHYVTHGTGEPILFLHGFPEYWGVWKKHLAELGKDYRVIAPDLRGYNLSSKPQEVEQYHIDLLVRDVLGLVEHLGLKKLTLVCQDWGALLGWSFLLRHPEYVCRFVTINITHPVLFNRELRENPRQQQASQYMLAFRTPQAETMITADDFAWPKNAVIGSYKANGAKFSDEDVDEWVRAWKQPGAITCALNYYRAAKMGPPDGQGNPGGSNLLEGLKPEQFQVRIPVLFIHGEQDFYLLADGHRGLEEYVPDLTFRRIPDGAHGVAMERPELVTRYIREFLRSR